jgi:hemolysin III
MFIENKYPILEEEQHEASFFPWYTLFTFAAILAPLFSLSAVGLPLVPVVLRGLRRAGLVARDLRARPRDRALAP